MAGLDMVGQYCPCLCWIIATISKAYLSRAGPGLLLLERGSISIVKTLPLEAPLLDLFALAHLHISSYKAAHPR